MKFNISPEHTQVVGNDRTVQEIAEGFENLRSLDFNERRDFYAEIYRDWWPTDAGYILLPDLWASLGDIADQIDMEVAYLVGLIQESIAENSDAGIYQEMVEPYAKPQCLGRTMELLRKGAHFCDSNMPLEDCEVLIMGLGDFCAGADSVSPATMARRAERDKATEEALLKACQERGGMHRTGDTPAKWASVTNTDSIHCPELMGELCWKTSAAGAGNSSRVFWTGAAHWASNPVQPKPSN